MCSLGSIGCDTREIHVNPGSLHPSCLQPSPTLSSFICREPCTSMAPRGQCPTHENSYPNVFKDKHTSLHHTTHNTPPSPPPAAATSPHRTSGFWVSGREVQAASSCNLGPGEHLFTFWYSCASWALLSVLLALLCSLDIRARKEVQEITDSPHFASDNRARKLPAPGSKPYAVFVLGEEKLFTASVPPPFDPNLPCFPGQWRYYIICPNPSPRHTTSSFPQPLCPGLVTDTSITWEFQKQRSHKHTYNSSFHQLKSHDANKLSSKLNVSFIESDKCHAD